MNQFHQVLYPMYINKLAEENKLDLITNMMIRSIESSSSGLDVIKQNLYTCNTAQAICYGNCLVKIWMYFANQNLEDNYDKVVKSFIKKLISFAISGNKRKFLENVEKIIIIISKSRENVELSYFLPVIFRDILSFRLKMRSNRRIRLNATKLFFVGFPYIDCRSLVVMRQTDLNEQLIRIKLLLTDKYSKVRSYAVISICMHMSMQWELFSEDIIENVLNIITKSLVNDPSPEVRRAVAKDSEASGKPHIEINNSVTHNQIKGIRVIIEEPKARTTIESYFHISRQLFFDTDAHVRIECCRLLLQIKKVFGPKYLDLINGDDVFQKIEEKQLRLYITRLMQPLIFPYNCKMSRIIINSLQLMKITKIRQLIFFRYLPYFVNIDVIVDYIITVIRVLHKSTHLTMPEAKHLLQAATVLWAESSLQEKIEYIHRRKIAKTLVFCMKDLMNHYKNTIVEEDLKYLELFLPA